MQVRSASCADVRSVRQDELIRKGRWRCKHAVCCVGGTARGAGQEERPSLIPAGLIASLLEPRLIIGPRWPCKPLGTELPHRALQNGRRCGSRQVILAVGDALRWVKRARFRRRTAAGLPPPPPLLPPPGWAAQVQPSASSTFHPAGPLAAKLHAEVRRLAAAVPGAPAFLPHVTLLGGVQSTEAAMLERARTLAGQLKVGGTRRALLHAGAAILSQGHGPATPACLLPFPAPLPNRHPCSPTALPLTACPAAPSSTSACTCGARRKRQQCRCGRWAQEGRALRMENAWCAQQIGMPRCIVCRREQRRERHTGRTPAAATCRTCRCCMPTSPGSSGEGLQGTGGRRQGG